MEKGIQAKCYARSMYKDVIVSAFGAFFITPLLIFCTAMTGAQVMSSDNFQIESDSLNFGGGFSSSESFDLKSTIGEIATGRSDSEEFSLRAGYRQMLEIFVSISEPAPIVMDPSIPGVVGGFSNGSTTVTVITDNPAGYSLQIAADQSPAMSSENNDTIADYVPITSADYNFLLPGAESRFGFSVESTFAAARFFNDGADCGVGSLNESDRCWDGLTTTFTEIVREQEANHPSGTGSILHFRVGVGSEANQPPGVYIATTTITAVPL